MPPANPDMRRQLKARLHELSPRAFELFAGELLSFIGLRNVAVTRYSGDGGIDAHGDLLSASDLVCVPTGVQVKRHRQNIQRPDIDRFIGALGGQFHHGIFITTAGYAATAKLKARSSPFLRVDTIDGEQLVALMGRHQLGMLAPDDAEPQLDEDFFLAFEAQASARPSQISEGRALYQTGAGNERGSAARPEDDLISMRALAYELRVDPYTVQAWVRGGRLLPDSTSLVGRRESYFFRRDRVATLRSQLDLASLPANGVEWRQAFLDFARSRILSRSYKPVLIKALLRLADRRGEVRIDALTHEVHGFYLQRQRDGLPTEVDGPLRDPATATPEAIKKLIVRNPLERFLIQHFLEYDAQQGIVRFAPQLWAELRFYELLDVQAHADEQLRFYYERLGQI